MADNDNTGRMLEDLLSNGAPKQEQQRIKNRLQSYVSNMDSTQQAKLNEILSDESKLRTVLQSQKAQELLRRLQKL